MGDDGPPAITGDISSLADLTLSNGADGDDSAVLLAAHPSASGMAGDGAGPQEKNWLVVTVTDGEPEEVERL